MINKFLDFIYPKSCLICHRHSDYLCDSCRKTFKRSLPECYKCRRLSPLYKTHEKCVGNLSHVFVAWEYNPMSSRVLKLLKYKSAYDVSKVLNQMVFDAVMKSSYRIVLRDTLLIPIPISYFRRSERGFNQTELITKAISANFGLTLCDKLLRSNAIEHQVSKNRDQRLMDKRNPFYVNTDVSVQDFKSFTLLDDVITTGTTLDLAAEVLKQSFPEIEINALCLFRGKPYYLNQ